MLGMLASQIERRAETLKKYETFALGEIAADEEAIKEGKVERTLESDMDVRGKLRTGLPTAVAVSKHLSDLKQRLDAVRKLQKLHIYNPPYEGGFKKSELLWVATQTKKQWYDFALHADLDEITNVLGEDIRLFDKFLLRFEQFEAYSKAEITFVTFLFFTLVWLFGLGVLWPLSALPGLEDMRFSKLWMLTAVSIGLGGLLTWLGSQFGEIRRLRELHWPKEATTSFMTESSAYAARVAWEEERKQTTLVR
jgi:hypothetical protein